MQYNLTHAGGADLPQLDRRVTPFNTKGVIRTSQFILLGEAAKSAAVLHDCL